MDFLIIPSLSISSFCSKKLEPSTKIVDPTVPVGMSAAVNVVLTTLESSPS